MVEATMCLPIFIVVMVSLALVVNFIASCEDIVFRECRIIHQLDMDAPQLFPKVKGENYKVITFGYLYSEGDMEDLISLQTRSDFEAGGPFGVLGKIQFRMRIRSRAFTGAVIKSGHLAEEDFKDGPPSQKVVVFPKYGIRFHIKGCRYALQEYEGEEVKIEMEKQDAELKGYTPCMICGGG